MKRRNFITTSALGLSAVSVFPSTIISDLKSISLEGLGDGFSSLYQKTNLRTVNSLSANFLKFHKNLTSKLDVNGYLFNSTHITALNNHCFLMPIKKEPLVGFDTNELVIILNNEGVYSHYLLNEHISMAFNELIKNYDKSINLMRLNINFLDLVTPVEIKRQVKGKESLFVFENTNGNLITLKATSKSKSAYIA